LILNKKSNVNWIILQKLTYAKPIAPCVTLPIQYYTVFRLFRKSKIYEGFCSVIAELRC